MATGDAVRRADYRNWDAVPDSRETGTGVAALTRRGLFPMSDEVKNYTTPGGCRRLQEDLARLWRVARPPILTTVAWVKPASASTPLAILSTRIDVASRFSPTTGAANNN